MQMSCQWQVICILAKWRGSIFGGFMSKRVLKQDQKPAVSESELTSVATKVSMVSIIGNIILSLLKFLAGVLAHSGAMVSDAVHSASDVFSSIVVIIGVHLSAKESDKEHPYGHERMECVAAIVLSVILLITGLGIGLSAIKNIFGFSENTLTAPGMLALVAAVGSIIVKEAMFWYTKFYAKQVDSSALLADAWHHRSDALSSVGALIGIIGARMGLLILDPIASLVICGFIAKAAYDIFKDAVDKMVDHACDEEMEQALYACALRTEGVLGIDLLRTRVFGNKIYVDLEIGVDGTRTLKDAHSVAEQVHNSIEQEFPKVKHIMVHVNPVEKAG
jgi:cation diffusion facilitator family transporter